MEILDLSFFKLTESWLVIIYRYSSWKEERECLNYIKIIFLLLICIYIYKLPNQLSVI